MIYLIILLILLLITIAIHRTQAPGWTPAAMGILGALSVVASIAVFFAPSKSEAAGEKDRKLYEQRLAVQAEYAAQWLEQNGDFKQAVYMSDRQLPEHKFLEDAFQAGAKTMNTGIYSGESGSEEANDSEMGFSFSIEDIEAVRTQFPDADVLVWSTPPRIRSRGKRQSGSRPLKFMVLNADKDWFDRISASPPRRRLLLAAIMDKPYGSRGSDQKNSISDDLQVAFQSEFDLMIPGE